MNGLRGTITLTGLALRRDRFKLSAGVLGLAALMAGMLAMTAGQTRQALAEEAKGFAGTPALRIFGLPSGASAGATTLIRGYLLLAVLAALLSTLAMVRHTRQNEETGRAELVGAAVVGRHASLAAAVIVAVGANIVLAGLLGLAAIATGQPAAGSFTAGASPRSPRAHEDGARRKAWPHQRSEQDAHDLAGGGGESNERRRCHPRSRSRTPEQRPESREHKVPGSVDRVIGYLYYRDRHQHHGGAEHGPQRHSPDMSRARVEDEKAAAGRYESSAHREQSGRLREWQVLRELGDNTRQKLVIAAIRDENMPGLLKRLPQELPFVLVVNGIPGRTTGNALQQQHRAEGDRHQMQHGTQQSPDRHRGC
jgi:uncharacterized membrane protein